MDTTKENIVKLMKAYPNLGDTGFNNGDERIFILRSFESYPAVIGWIAKHLQPRKTFNMRLGSYQLKHKAEKDIDLYVPNGVFIMAMLLAGYKVRTNGPNAFFCITELKGNQVGTLTGKPTIDEKLLISQGEHL